MSDNRITGTPFAGLLNKTMRLDKNYKSQSREDSYGFDPAAVFGQFTNGIPKIELSETQQIALNPHELTAFINGLSEKLGLENQHLEAKEVDTSAASIQSRLKQIFQEADEAYK